MNTNTGSFNREEYYMLRLEKLAFWLGIIAIPSTFVYTFLAPCILGSMAVVFAVLSKGGNLRFSRRARAAAILGTAAIVINVALFGFTLVAMKELLSDPQGRQQINDLLYRQSGMTLDELFSLIPWLK